MALVTAPRPSPPATWDCPDCDTTLPFDAQAGHECVACEGCGRFTPTHRLTATHAGEGLAVYLCPPCDEEVAAA